MQTKQDLKMASVGDHGERPKRDKAYSAIRRVIMESPEPWNKETLLESFHGALERGWDSRGVRSYAWAFWLDPKYQRVTPTALRRALFLGLTAEGSPAYETAECFREHYEADPSRYAFVQ